MSVWKSCDCRWKVYAQVLGSEVNELTRVLDELHISLTKKQLQLDPAPLLKLVMSQFFGNHGGFVDALLSSFPDPITAAADKVHRFWQGDQTSEVAKAMMHCDPTGPLVINVVKMYRNQDASDFYAFGRVMSGTVQSGDQVDVCGESYV